MTKTKTNISQPNTGYLLSTECENIHGKLSFFFPFCFFSKYETHFNVYNMRIYNEQKHTGDLFPFSNNRRWKQVFDTSALQSEEQSQEVKTASISSKTVISVSKWIVIKLSDNKKIYCNLYSETLFTCKYYYKSNDKKCLLLFWHVYCRALEYSRMDYCERCGFVMSINEQLHPITEYNRFRITYQIVV